MESSCPKCGVCGRKITMQFTGGFCCWPTREPTDRERIHTLDAQLAAATQEVERLMAELESLARATAMATIIFPEAIDDMVEAAKDMVAEGITLDNSEDELESAKETCDWDDLISAAYEIAEPIVARFNERKEPHA